MYVQRQPQKTTLKSNHLDLFSAPSVFLIEFAFELFRLAFLLKDQVVSR